MADSATIMARLDTLQAAVQTMANLTPITPGRKSDPVTLNKGKECQT